MSNYIRPEYQATRKTAKSKTVRTWAFFYHVNRTETQFVAGTVECKVPQRTALYKKLRTLWQDSSQMTGIGYTNDLESMWLHWPQSPLIEKIV